MVAQMNLLNIFKKRTNYPKQQLTDKQKELLDLIDNYLVEKSDSKLISTTLGVKSFKIGLFSQHLSREKLFSYFTSKMEHDKIGYIPRTIALVVDADGTWCFYIGIRDNSKCHETALELFFECVNRTNQARVDFSFPSI
jgi:hypothetical protein